MMVLNREVYCQEGRALMLVRIQGNRNEGIRHVLWTLRTEERR